MNNEQEDSAVKTLVISAGIVIIIAILYLFIQPYFEMQSFNRHAKGAKATYCDALFSELRIIP